MSSSIIKKAIDIVSQNDKIASFGVVDSAGYPNVSAILAVKNIGLKEFWFTSGLTTHKVACINKNNKVCICYFNNYSNITLTGTASIITYSKIKKDMWQDWLIDYYKDGPTDTNYCLIKAIVYHARLYIDGKNVDYDIDELVAI